MQREKMREDIRKRQMMAKKGEVKIEVLATPVPEEEPKSVESKSSKRAVWSTAPSEKTDKTE